MNTDDFLVREQLAATEQSNTMLRVQLANYQETVNELERCLQPLHSVLPLLEPIVRVAAFIDRRPHREALVQCFGPNGEIATLEACHLQALGEWMRKYRGGRA